MKVSRSRMSLAEEWRNSSWMRKAAVLRLGYTLMIPVATLLAKSVLSVEWYIWLLKLTPGPMLLFMAGPCITVLSMERVPVAEDLREIPWKSPNLSFVRQLFLTEYQGVKLPRWAVALNLCWGVSTAILFAPLLMAEWLVWGRVK